MLYRGISSDLMNNLNESDGEERRLRTNSSRMILCQVGSSSPMEVRRVSPNSTPIQVVGGLREIERGHNSLRVNHCWLIKDPRDPQKYLSIQVSKSRMSLSEGILERMLTVGQL